MSPIHGYPGYFVTACGDVFSERSGALRRVEPRLHKGYRHVNIKRAPGRANKVKRPVHQLVLLAFVGARPTDYHECRHLDGDPLNNVAWNLSWGTRKQNVADAMRHGTHACLRQGPRAPGWRHGRYAVA